MGKYFSFSNLSHKVSSCSPPSQMCIIDKSKTNGLSHLYESTYGVKSLNILEGADTCPTKDTDKFAYLCTIIALAQRQQYCPADIK